ncbi:MAG: SUF system NifU family Fe-S cluster assembly protein [Firmicutes bacterium]|nr:SUF system NifU family Fe-S cluster assembly protein [Bacillota bacterium]
MQLDDLYREVIMDHYTHPRNKGMISPEALTVELKNPTCGDEITLQLLVEDDRVKDVRFEGTGCSISMASASMMSEAVKGKSVAEAKQISEEFRKLMKGQEADPDLLGDLESLGGVSRFPARIKCATLAWNALDRTTEQAL